MVCINVFIPSFCVCVVLATLGFCEHSEQKLMVDGTRDPPFRPDFGQIKGGFPGGGSSQDDNLDTPTGNPPLEPENEQSEDRFCSVFPLQIAF